MSYTLSEYLSFIREHGPVIAARVYAARGKPFSGLSATQLALVQASATVGFFIKKWRMKTCTFVVSAEEVRRTTALGTKVIPWSEVTEVLEYSEGFMLCLKRGAMPLPYRCLNPEQEVSLRHHFANWKAAYQPAT